MSEDGGPTIIESICFIRIFCVEAFDFYTIVSRKKRFNFFMCMRLQQRIVVTGSFTRALSALLCICCVRSIAEYVVHTTDTENNIFERFALR